MAFDFDVIIIGSGFGATVVALDQAAKGKRVFILERGVWWSTTELSAENPMNPYVKLQTVQYWPRPDHRRGLTDMLAVVQATGVLGDLQDFAGGVADFFTGRKRPVPLYRYNTFKEADILTAIGVGGGSLIYSNVTLEPFQDTGTGTYPVMDDWPAAAKLTPADYKDAVNNWMTPNRGKPVPIVTKYPAAMTDAELAGVNSSDPRLLGRSRFLRDASASAALPANLKADIAEPWKPLALQVNEANPTDPTKLASNHNYCERQGRCFLGCLPGARHTLNKTLVKMLPLAAQDKVLVRSLAKVKFIEPITGGGYTVHYQGMEEGGGEFHPTAKTVVLAAGSLGTSEILLRSREKNQGKLKLSDKLGSKFSTNGDFSGFITVDREKLAYPIYATRGPINTSHVTFRNGKLLVNVEDAGIPAMFASLVERTLNMIKEGQQANLMDLLGLLWDQGQLPDYSDPNNMETESEMLMGTSWFNCMGKDDATGKFDLHNDNLRLTFSQPIAQHPTFKKAEDILRGLATAMGGTFHAFPMWDGLQPFVSRKLVVTHPLGGCPIGASSTDGVVNAKGQVYNTTTGGTTVNDGLYVADGSIVPGALAVNPTLTIVAMARRVAASIA
ncbi:MAG TPA: GMC oxidoreductase [Candidatus Angelobacter sp.]